MDRLTHWCPDGSGGGEYRVNENGSEYSGPSIDRLAEYENTYLEPKEVKSLDWERRHEEERTLAAMCGYGIDPDRLTDIIDAEKEGRLLILRGDKQAKENDVLPDYKELVKKLRKQCAEMDCGNCKTCVKNEAAEAIEALQLFIQGIEKVRHAHWEEDDKDKWRCSDCGKGNEYAYSWDRNTQDWTILQDNYCPNCGAKMDEEVMRNGAI